MWYRNTSRSTKAKYHKAAIDYINSGLAVCGANIKHASHVASSLAEAEETNRLICKVCRKVVEKN
jgi:hypothetical protein